jgi:hypothetical protein
MHRASSALAWRHHRNRVPLLQFYFLLTEPTPETLDVSFGEPI